MKGRLTQLRKMGFIKASELDNKNPKPKKREAVAERRAFLPGWDMIAPHTWTRTLETGLSLADAGGSSFDASHFANQRLRLRKGLEPSPSAPVPCDSFSFFDLETTGLSGGAGTIAFLAAVGFFEGDSFLITQAFIDDFPGEPYFLDFTVNLLSGRPHLVTYNGAAFDLPLLRTRCILNALPVPEFAHIDALQISRRFWRRSLGSCSLQALEAAVLGDAREDDVPGFLIPRLWLEYSGSADPDPGVEQEVQSLAAMGKVARHNALDVKSLARLFLRIHGIMMEPEKRWSGEKVHAPHLALELIAAGRSVEGMAILEEAGAAGDQIALRLLARHYRRAGNMEAYGRVVGGMDRDSIEGCVEMAKYHEHYGKNAEAAYACTERALSLAGEHGTDAGLKESLERRLYRLQRKLEKAAVKIL